MSNQGVNGRLATPADKHRTQDGEGLRLIEFRQFDTSFAVPPSQEEDTRRRLMTLLAEPTATSDRLLQSEVVRVTNTAGEHFALKRLCPLPSDTDPTSRRGREAALFEEYRNLLAVNQLQGFPQVYGYGVSMEDGPAILEEWVEGTTLHDALVRGLLPLSDDGTGVDGVVVATIALSVLQTLVSTTYLQGTFAHRDISTRNIMLRDVSEDSPLHAGRSLASLQTCLVDLGSAIFMRHDEATFTMTMDVWRNATPEYAPPEMLALGDRRYVDARRSPAIDVYALCSVAYEAYCGATPYQVSAHPDADPLALKSAMPPQPDLHSKKDAPLVAAIMGGLALDQANRPTARELLDQIASWRQDVAGMQVVAPPVPAASQVGGTHLTISSEPPTHMDVPAPAGNEAAIQEGTRRRKVSRRGFVVGAAVAAGLVLAGGWWGIHKTDEGRSWLFGRMTWQDLEDLAARLEAAGDREAALPLAVDAGIAHEDGTMVQGLAKEVVLSDGTSATAQLVDFCHDDREDGGKAGLTFAFVTPVAARPMADATMVSGGWDRCDMRAWLNGDFMDSLPAELAAGVVPVTKLTNNQGSARDVSAVTATTDLVWLFSIREFGGPRASSSFNDGYQYLADILNAEGDQYQLWKDLNVNPMNENANLVRTWQGEPCYWWNRSPSPDCSEDYGETWFNRVGPNGDVFHYATAATGDENTTLVMPGFCL